MVIYDWVFMILFTEAVTELVVKSEFFWPLRKLLHSLGKNNKLFSFLHNLLDCGYCFSVWAAFLALVLIFSNNNIVLLFMTGVVIHRLSNLVHNMIDRSRMD